MRLLLIALLCAAGVQAQFFDLATNEDGSVLYFSSSLRLRGSDQVVYPKLFRWDASGFTLRVQRDMGEPIGWSVQNFYQIREAAVSADATVLAYTGARHCNGGSGCLSVERSQATIESAGRTTLTLPGKVRLSPNGKWAFLYGHSTMAPPPLVWLNTETGAQRQAQERLYTLLSRQSIADDGRVVAADSTGIRVLRPEGTIEIPTRKAPELPIIDRSASRVFYTSDGTITALDLQTRTETVIATVPGAKDLRISSDAAQLLFLAEGQAILLDVKSGARRQLATGIIEAVLSGDGRVVFAATGKGQLLRIVTATGEQTELLPRTPDIIAVDAGSPRSVLSPGSMVRITGTNLVEGPVEMRVGDVTVPLISVTPTAITAQLPWDFQPAKESTFTLLSGTSPFEPGPQTVSVKAIAPAFLGGEIMIVAVHQDWRSLVTAENPAEPGEVVHTYMTGLGPVWPTVPTGSPAPLDVLSRSATPTCEFWDGKPNRAEVLFAGLAPGTIGLYQVSLRVPSGLSLVTPIIVCTSNTDDQAVGSFHVRTP